MGAAFVKTGDAGQSNTRDLVAQSLERVLEEHGLPSVVAKAGNRSLGATVDASHYLLMTVPYSGGDTAIYIYENQFEIFRDRSSWSFSRCDYSSDAFFVADAARRLQRFLATGSPLAKGEGPWPIWGLLARWVRRTRMRPPGGG